MAAPRRGNNDLGGLRTTERHPFDDPKADAEDTDLDLRVEESEEIGQTEIGSAEHAVVGVGE
jgi:hypothetical protein